MIFQGFNSTLLLLHPFSTLFQTENEYKVLFQHDWNRIDAPINLFQSRIYFNSSLPQNIYLLIHTTNQALRENQSNFSLFYARIRPVSKIRYRLNRYKWQWPLQRPQEFYAQCSGLYRGHLVLHTVFIHHAHRKFNFWREKL